MLNPEIGTETTTAKHNENNENNEENDYRN